MKLMMLFLLLVLSGSSLALKQQPLGSANGNQGSQARTPVEIISIIQKGDQVRLSAMVTGATRRSQLVVFVNYQGQSGLRIAKNAAGEPEMPFTRDSLPSEDSVGRSSSEWRLNFQHNESEGRILEVYVVVCDVISNAPGWPNSRDYRGFRFLPFDKVDSIDDALLILRDFGWRPTGLTKVDR